MGWRWEFIGEIETMKFLILYLFLFSASFLVSNQLRPPVRIEKIISQTCLDSADHKTSNATNIPLIAVKSLVVPCKQETTKLFHNSEKTFGLQVQEEVKRITSFVIAETQRKLTPEEVIQSAEASKLLQISANNLKNHFPRFKIIDASPEDYLYYGIHAGDYTDVSRFLGERVCSNPSLAKLSNENAYLGLFFSINQLRDYGGLVQIINERIVTLIEGKFSLAGDEKYFERRKVPSGIYAMWAHEDINRGYRGFMYQLHSISMEDTPWSRSYFLSPWLYNSCNKSIATIHNNCSIDPSYDMEMKEFFYLTTTDLMTGNIYCKKSNDPQWTRIATFEFLRI